MVLSKSKIANFVLTAMNIREKGYRLNVGIIVANSDGKLLYCKRKKSNNWQFPQGGIDKNEDIFLAAQRELYEEVGISKKKIKLIKESNNWYKYDLPSKYIRNNFYGINLEDEVNILPNIGYSHYFKCLCLLANYKK